MKSLLRPDVTKALVWAVAIAVGAVWANQNAYNQSLWMSGVLYALMALGMYIPFVVSGTLSMAYSAFAAIGGYSAAIVAQSAGKSMWLGWLVGFVLAAIASGLLGWAVRRLSGFYLVAVTLLFAAAFESWAGQASLTGKGGGLGGLPKISSFGVEWSVMGLTILGAALVWAIAAMSDRLRLSHWGVIARISRDRSVAVEANGTNVALMKIVALGIGGGLAALGGALFVANVNSITSSTFTLSLVFIATFIPVIGGMATPWGVLTGTVIVAYLTFEFDLFKGGGTFFIALALLIILLISPSGINGVLTSTVRWVRDGIKKSERSSGAV